MSDKDKNNLTKAEAEVDEFAADQGSFDALINRSGDDLKASRKMGSSFKNSKKRMSFKQNDEDISYLKLQRHVENLHPTKMVILENGEQEQVPFGVGDTLGTLMPVKRFIGPTTPMAR